MTFHIFSAHTFKKNLIKIFDYQSVEKTDFIRFLLRDGQLVP